MADDLIIKKFNDLDFDFVDFKSGDWSWGRGGYPTNDNVWHISHYCGHPSGDIVETRYEAPKCINEMLERRFEQGKREQLRKIKNALDL